MYEIKVLNDWDFDELHKTNNRVDKNRLRNSLGFADMKTNKIYVRTTHNPRWDLGTIEHEINELLSKQSPHELNNIRYKGNTPEIPAPPPAPKYKTAEELFNESVGLMKGQYPLAYGARESALTDIGKGTSFYEQFQPTSIEQALASQYFANVWPDVEREIKGALSLSGMAYSPILAERLGKAKGQVSFDIGSYLSNLGQERARYSLEQRLGIDPYGGMVYPQEQMGQQQDQMQKQAEYEYQLAKSQADYANAVAKVKKQQQKVMALTTIGGIALGAATGGLGLIGAGGLMAAGIGGVIGGAAGGLSAPLWGGGGTPPISVGDALSMTQSLQRTPKMGSAQPVNLENTKIPASDWKLPNPYKQLGWQGMYQ